MSNNYGESEVTKTQVFLSHLNGLRANELARYLRICKGSNYMKFIKLWNRLESLTGHTLTFDEITDFIEKMNNEEIEIERSQRENTKEELRRGESHSHRHDSR